MKGLTCREIKDEECLPTHTDTEQGPWLEYSIVSLSEEEEPIVIEKSSSGHWPATPLLSAKMLNTLPESAIRVTFRPCSIAILWNEEGELEDVQTLIDFLDQLAVTENTPQPQG